MAIQAETIQASAAPILSMDTGTVGLPETESPMWVTAGNIEGLVEYRTASSGEALTLAEDAEIQWHTRLAYPHVIHVGPPWRDDHGSLTDERSSVLSTYPEPLYAGGDDWDVAITSSVVELQTSMTQTWGTLPVSERLIHRAITQWRRELLPDAIIERFTNTSADYHRDALLEFIDDNEIPMRLKERLEFFGSEFSEMEPVSDSTRLAVNELVSWLHSQADDVSVVVSNGGTMTITAVFPRDVRFYVETERDGSSEAAVTRERRYAHDVPVDNIADLTREAISVAVASI